MALAQRLQVIAGLCQGPAIVDIGFDHALLLRHLAARHPAWRLLGIEVAAHFCARATVPDGVELRVGDGLQGLEPVDTVVLAGLGEEKIRQLLTRDWAIAGRCRRIVACPTSIDGRLHGFLAARGWRAVDECLLIENRRLYRISASEPGQETASDPQRLAAGPRLHDRADPLLAAWLARHGSRFARQQGGGALLAGSNAPLVVENAPHKKP